jgi:hypothetical protein
MKSITRNSSWRHHFSVYATSSCLSYLEDSHKTWNRMSELCFAIHRKHMGHTEIHGDLREITDYMENSLIWEPYLVLGQLLSVHFLPNYFFGVHFNRLSSCLFPIFPCDVIPSSIPTRDFVRISHIPMCANSSFLDGNDLRTMLSDARNLFGVCPSLTIREHVAYRCKGRVKLYALKFATDAM